MNLSEFVRKVLIENGGTADNVWCLYGDRKEYLSGYLLAPNVAIMESIKVDLMAFERPGWEHWFHFGISQASSDLYGNDRVEINLEIEGHKL